MSDSSHSSSRTRASQARARAAHSVRRSGDGGSRSIRSSRMRSERMRRTRLGAAPTSSPPLTSTSSRCSSVRSRRRRSTGWSTFPGGSGVSSRPRIQVPSRSSSSVTVVTGAAGGATPGTGAPVVSRPLTVSSSLSVDDSSTPRSSSRRARNDRRRSLGRGVAQALQLGHGLLRRLQRRLGHRAQIPPVDERQQRRRQVPAQRAGPAPAPLACSASSSDRSAAIAARSATSPSSLDAADERSRASARPAAYSPNSPPDVLAAHVHQRLHHLEIAAIHQLHQQLLGGLRLLLAGPGQPVDHGHGDARIALAQTPRPAAPGSGRRPRCGSWAMLAASEVAARRHSVGPRLDDSARSISRRISSCRSPAADDQQAAGDGHVPPHQRLPIGQQPRPGRPHGRAVEHPQAGVVALLRPAGRLARRPLQQPRRQPPRRQRAGRGRRQPLPLQLRAGQQRQRQPVGAAYRWRSAAAATAPPGPAPARPPAPAAIPAPAPGPASRTSRRRPRSGSAAPGGPARASPGPEAGRTPARTGRPRPPAWTASRGRRPARWPAPPARWPAATRRASPPAAWAAGRRRHWPAPPHPGARPSVARLRSPGGEASQGLLGSPDRRASVAEGVLPSIAGILPLLTPPTHAEGPRRWSRAYG